MTSLPFIRKKVVVKGRLKEMENNPNEGIKDAFAIKKL